MPYLLGFGYNFTWSYCIYSLSNHKLPFQSVYYRTFLLRFRIFRERLLRSFINLPKLNRWRSFSRMVYNRNFWNLGFVIAAVIAGKDGAPSCMDLVLRLDIRALFNWILLCSKIMETITILPLYEKYLFSNLGMFSQAK